MLEWRLTLCWHKPEWGSWVGDEEKASVNSHHKNRRPKEKRLSQGRQWPSLVHSRFASWPIGYARLGRGDYHGLFEIWCQLQWTWWSGWPSVAFPVNGRGSAGAPMILLLAKSSILLCESERSLSATGLAEAFITEEDSTPRVRRLHLIVVDLHRRRRLTDRVRRLFSDIQVDRCANECWNTLPIPWKPNQEAYQLRYVFGYAMDGSDLPCYMLAADQHFPFYCTPYYGFSPPSLHDTHTMILELATFLISFAFLADGSPIQALETAPPSPGSLLSPLSSLHSDYMSVYPGEGVFFLDNCPDPTSGDPMIVTWLPPLLDAHLPSLPSFLTCLLASRLGTAILCPASLLTLFS